MDSDQKKNVRLHGCVEVGGTTVRVAVLELPHEKIENSKHNIEISDIKILEKIVINTSERENISKSAIEMFKKYNVEQIGISSFGPLQLRFKAYQKFVCCHRFFS